MKIFICIYLNHLLSMWGTNCRSANSQETSGLDIHLSSTQWWTRPPKGVSSACPTSQPFGFFTSFMISVWESWWRTFCPSSSPFEMVMLMKDLCIALSGLFPSSVVLISVGGYLPGTYGQICFSSSSWVISPVTSDVLLVILACNWGKMWSCFRTEGWMVSCVTSSVDVGSCRVTSLASANMPVLGLRQLSEANTKIETFWLTCEVVAFPKGSMALEGTPSTCSPVITYSQHLTGKLK